MLITSKYYLSIMQVSRRRTTFPTDVRNIEETSFKFIYQTWNEFDSIKLNQKFA